MTTTTMTKTGRQDRTDVWKKSEQRPSQRSLLQLPGRPLPTGWRPTVAVGTAADAKPDVASSSCSCIQLLLLLLALLATGCIRSLTEGGRMLCVLYSGHGSDATKFTTVRLKRRSERLIFMRSQQRVNYTAATDGSGGGLATIISVKYSPHFGTEIQLTVRGVLDQQVLT
jgi:hypothetical protein